MKKMYVITMSQGSYDDYSVKLVACTEDYVKAEMYVKKMNALCQSVNDKNQEFYKHEYEIWKSNNPRPSEEVKGLKEVPIFFQKPTVEMQLEKNRIMSDNEALEKEHQRGIWAWEEKLRQFDKNWHEQNLTQEQQSLMQNISIDSYWDIEEVKLL